MKAFVAVTDSDWFEFLRARAEIDEVNFWQPSGRNHFRALQPGEPFLFKLHSPRNFVVGGGFFAHFSLLPHRLAWEFFEEENGAESLEQMERRIGKYRRGGDPKNDYTIGCILLSSPFFFRESEWIPVPADWKPNIVRGKGYDLRDGLGAELWKEVRLRLEGSLVGEGPPDGKEAPIHGEPTLVLPRLGQGTFRTLIADTYERRCAVTAERALPALDAAHIRSVRDGGRHEVENGLLLRSDVHRLFDSGYVTVGPDYRFRVSSRLKSDFDNGEPYYPFQGEEIWLPKSSNDKPRKEFLEWHADVRFRG